jgi:hypothetical protein
MLKKAASEAAESEGPEAYWRSTLRGMSDRERSWRLFSASC